MREGAAQGEGWVGEGEAQGEGSDIVSAATSLYLRPRVSSCPAWENVCGGGGEGRSGMGMAV